MTAVKKKLATLSPKLFALDSIPRFDEAFEFPWEKAEQTLAKQLQLKTLKITPGSWEWIEKPSFPTTNYSLKLHIATIEGAAFFSVSERDLKQIAALLVTGDSNKSLQLDPEYEKGFLPFLVYEVFSVLKELSFPPGLALQCSLDEALPEEPALCLDICFELNGKNFSAQTAIDAKMHQALQQYAAKNQRQNKLELEKIDLLELIVHLEAGRTKIPLSTWKKASPGDFLILENCSLDVDGGDGRVLLTIDGHPYFRGKLKEGCLKILEHPLAYEEGSMADKEDEYEEEDDNEEEDEVEEEDEEEDEEEEEEEEEDEEEDEEENSKEEVKQEAAPPQKANKVSEEEKGKIPKPEEILLPIVIEVGRIKLSVKTLTELEPGNVLELDIHPEKGVDLVVSGKRIGRGELLQIGETLGVRILELGS